MRRIVPLCQRERELGISLMSWTCFMRRRGCEHRTEDQVLGTEQF